MLVELAIGDALGAGFEYAPAEFVLKNNNLGQYFKHNLEGFLPAGSYTDDTQMTIAIAEMMVSKEEWTRQNLARRFVECFKRDPRDSYARKFGKLLQEVKDGDELLNRLKPESDRSGAAMRTTPLGLLPDLKEALNKCAIQASITHATYDGINAALAATCLTHYFVYDKGPKADVVKFIQTHVPGNWGPRQEKVGAPGWQSVRAAITAILECDCLSGVLRRSIAFTGDVDTVGTIAMAAASFSKEIKKDIPVHLTEGLENGAYGRDFLAKLDRDLMDVVGLGSSQRTVTPQDSSEEII